MVHAFRKIVLACFVSGAALALGAAAGCSSDNTTTGITPITGIVIRSDSLIAGRGCGMADAQVLKYVAVVSRTDKTVPVAAGLYDCFADGIFSSLDTSGGNGNFNLRVYAFDAAAWARYSGNVQCAVEGVNAQATDFVSCAGGVLPQPPPDAGTAATQRKLALSMDAGGDASGSLDAAVDASDAASSSDASVVSDAAGDATDAAVPSDAGSAQDGAGARLPPPPPSLPVVPVGVVLDLISTWRTTCTASQQADIEVLAVCDPLR